MRDVSLGKVGRDFDCVSLRLLARIRSAHDRTRRSAPDFELPDEDGNPVKLSKLRGKPVVVYFYPKADTLGTKTNVARAF